MWGGMRYIVYGPGGIGGALGGHLFRSGREVVLVGRGSHIEKIRRHGLDLITPKESFRLKVPAVDGPGGVDWKEGDVVYLAMKSQDTEGALRDLVATGVAVEDLRIICFQNAIVNESMASRYFPHVYGAMINVPGIYLEDGVVYNPALKNTGYVELGVYPSGVDSYAETFVKDLKRAGYAVFINGDVMGAKAVKMLGNLANALVAITDGKGDAVPYREKLREEAVQCLDAAGLPLEDPEVARARVMAHRFGNSKSRQVQSRGSSWQSLIRKQGSIEADFLNGEIVRLGRIYRIPTPYNELLQRVSGAMARNRELPGKYTAEQLMEMVEASDAGPS